MHHNQFAQDCDEASRPASMLIPTYELWGTSEGYRAQGIVQDEVGNIIWRGAILENSAAAMKDAADAIDRICYERRHQLPLELSA